MINRRECLVRASSGFFASIFSTELGAQSSIRLLLVHGRDQQGLDPAALKLEWIDALRTGANAVGRTLPGTIDVSFPYYGDRLDNFASQFDIPLTEDIHSKGSKVDDDFLAFEAEIARSLQLSAGITDAQVSVEYGSNPKPKGPQNWEWVQAIVRALDKYVGAASQAGIETFMRDVFLYTTRAGVRDAIDEIVAGSLTEQPTVIVGHSLGSVVAYNVLRSNQRMLQIPLFVTIGCPLGIRAIRDQLRPLRFPQWVNAWYNAYDARDIVALYPLDRSNFPVSPDIDNYRMVNNHTNNRHGIIGYLDDPSVANRIIAALAP
jgi:hypothetical protein